MSAITTETIEKLGFGLLAIAETSRSCRCGGSENDQVSVMSVFNRLRSSIQAIAVGKIPIYGKKITRDFVQPLHSAVQSKVRTLFQMNSHSILNLQAFRLIQCGDRSKEYGGVWDSQVKSNSPTLR